LLANAYPLGCGCFNIPPVIERAVPAIED